jgi:hypothetical protein
MSLHHEGPFRYLKDYEPQIDYLDTAALFLEHAGRKPNATEQAALARHFETEITQNIGGPEWSAATLGQRLDDMYEAAKRDIQDEAKIKKLVTRMKQTHKQRGDEVTAQPVTKINNKPVLKKELPDGTIFTIHEVTKRDYGLTKKEQRSGRFAPMLRARALAILAVSAVTVPTAAENIHIAAQDIGRHPVPADVQLVIPGVGTLPTGITDIVRANEESTAIRKRAEELRKNGRSPRAQSVIEPTYSLSLPNPADILDGAAWFVVMMGGLAAGVGSAIGAVSKYEQPPVTRTRAKA